jgi:alpha-beta hydrolase superfamily lysophospholipase
MAYKFAPGEKLNIIGHSHGGNIAAIYSDKSSARKINNLITL